MTSVAANSFNSTPLQADATSNAGNAGNRGVRQSGSLRNITGTTYATRLHSEPLHGAGNLADWKSNFADIQLLPSSCVDSYSDLVVRGNPVPLISAEPDALNLSVSTAYSVLATKHKAENLQRRCQKLVAETTSNNPSVKHNLYLVAGFIAYRSNGESRHAPLLLIPVSLIRTRGRGSAYAIQYQTGKLLQVNPQVAQMCSKHIDRQIKPFENTADLREFLRGIESSVHKDFACHITANTGIISLHTQVLGDPTPEQIFDSELTRTKPGIDFQPLPAIPAAFDAQLAIRVLRFVDPAYLHTTLHNLAGHADKNITHTQDADPDISATALAKYHNCAGWLIDIGLGHWQLKNIAALPRRVQTMETNINLLLADSEFNKYFHKKYHTVDMLYRLNKAKDKILNSPPEMLHHSISLHADSDTRLLLQQAKIQASSLQHEMELIHETFDMGAVPVSSSLRRMIEIISRRNSEPQLENPEYFRARRTLNEILKHPIGVLTDSDIDRLEKLAGTLQFAETFNSDPYYKRHFGSLFKGIDTNWQRLDSVVSYTRSLAQDLGSSLLVAEFADQWGSFRRDFESFATRLEAAASSVHKLGSLLPMFVDKNTRLEHASRTAEKFRCRIDQWQKYLRQNMADLELTPFQMLSHMDLGDPSYPEVTLSQQAFDERIYQHIVGHGLSEETVSATSDWLENVIGRLGTDTATVRRFLDRESSLQSNLN